MEDKDLYATLGVPRTASTDEIKKAYRRLARKHHPDVNPGNADAGERFKRISEAYDVLGDPEKRKLYDEFGLAGVQAGFNAEQARAHRAGAAFRGWETGTGPAGGFGGYSTFEDLFGDIIGERGFAGRPEPGADVESEIEIDLLDAVRGRSTTISLQRAEACSACSGLGTDVSNATTCSECGGRGRVRVGKGPVAFTRACARCAGLGKTGTRPCAECGGRGQHLVTERLNVHIPAGVDTGSRVRVAGKGGVGVRGGPPGDLFIRVRVRPHPLLERRGDDLFMDLPLTVPEAVFGATIQVPTPDGEVRVRVPAGSQTGRQLRVKGRGVQHLRGKGRGDLYLRLVVHVPEKIDDAVREAVRGIEPGYVKNPRQDLRL